MSPKHFFFSPEHHPGASNLDSRTGGEAITVMANRPSDPDSQEVFVGISMDYSSADKGEAWAAVDANEVRDAIDRAVGKREEAAAAKPKAPEWEAVVASRIDGLGEHIEAREVYYLTDSGRWESETYFADADELVDPVPLVELPEREEILAALREGWDAWGHDEEALGGADGHRADAVLKLLKRR